MASEYRVPLSCNAALVPKSQPACIFMTIHRFKDPCRPGGASGMESEPASRPAHSASQRSWRKPMRRNTIFGLAEPRRRSQRR